MKVELVSGRITKSDISKLTEARNAAKLKIPSSMYNYLIYLSKLDEHTIRITQDAYGWLYGIVHGIVESIDNENYNSAQDGVNEVMECYSDMNKECHSTLTESDGKIWETVIEARENVEGWKIHYPYAKGQITRFEAGIIYRAMKEGKVHVSKEVIKSLYDQTEEYVGHAIARFNQTGFYYERIYDIVEFILNGEYLSAQKKIDEIEREEKTGYRR